MKKPIHYILTEKELEFIRYLSKFPDPINESVYKGNEDILYCLIEKGFLHWEESKLFFTSDVLREFAGDGAEDDSPNP